MDRPSNVQMDTMADYARFFCELVEKLDTVTVQPTPYAATPVALEEEEATYYLTLELSTEPHEQEPFLETLELLDVEGLFGAAGLME